MEHVRCGAVVHVRCGAVVHVRCGAVVHVRGRDVAHILSLLSVLSARLWVMCFLVHLSVCPSVRMSICLCVAGDV